MSPSQFRHTQFAVYTTALVTALAAGYDSCQGIVQKYHINKKWFYLYGVMTLFAYLYVRPLIRRRLGSASSGYINWGTVYAVWLCSAVFYHLPSFESLGFDIKADVSILLTIFLLSCGLLGIFATLFSLVMSFRSISRKMLYIPPSSRELFSVVVLNAMNLAMACSTYYSFCGNSPVSKNLGYERDSAREIVCKWLLKPLPANKHPIYSPWMIYGESACAESSCGSAMVDGQEKNTSRPETDLMDGPSIISPVFTTWLTLFALFMCNSAADFISAFLVRSAHVSSRESQRRSVSRGKSLDIEFDQDRRTIHDHLGSFRSLSEIRSLWNSQSLARNGSIDALLKTVSSVGAMWSPSAFDSKIKSIFSKDDSSIPFLRRRNDQLGISGHDLASLRHHDSDWLSGVGIEVPRGTPAPSFLPMFPWYSGTSADLLKTVFDLVVSLKFFVGRFDMRTMLAATSLEGSFLSGTQDATAPHEGDGFTFEHLAGKKELWLDFCADTGDGGNSTYSIARCLAAPKIVVDLPEEQAKDAGVSAGIRMLPRGDVLVHGGDLAYPNPTDETYEQRLFQPYNDAFPSPSHVHPGHLVVNKPDLPAVYWMDQMTECQHSQLAEKNELETKLPCKACMKAAALKSYRGPSAFLIPGNHDWIDGLEIFQRHIVHRGWLGGWLLPQEKSYFALKLPQKWWLLGIDLALEEDIDMCQYRYFAKIAEDRMEADDLAIIVTHCPQWLVDWFWGHHTGKNLRQLVRGPLRGKVKLRLAGDLHFYMRHSFKTYGSEGISMPASSLSTPAGNSPMAGGSPRSSMVPSSGLLTDKTHRKLINKLSHLASETKVSGKSIKPTLQSDEHEKYGSPFVPYHRKEVLPSSSPPSVEGSSPPTNWWPGLRVKSPINGGSPPELDKMGGRFYDPYSEWEAPPSGWTLNDAEHLVVCGSGGAFLHPTHVFAYSRFRPIHDPSAGPIHVRPIEKSVGRRSSYPSSSSLYSMKKMEQPKPAGGEYRCIASFPTATDSLQIGRLNLHTFRHVNSRFDLIGGMLYYLLVISALPRCSEVAQIFEASSVSDAIFLFFQAMWSTFIFIFSKTYISCAFFGILFLISLGFARGGGVGAISGVPPAARRKPEYRGFALAVKARMGGLSAQITYALMHALMHLFCAIALILLLELGVETVVRYEGIGEEGYHSLYRWYRKFEAEHFPDPSNLRGTLSTWTLSLYPNAIKWLFALFDVPEAIAVSQSAACNAGASFTSLTRLQTLGYYIGVLLYFWVLATPTVGFLFGLYLYISGNWLHVHYDESFSALQYEDRKSFLKLHIDKDGNLELYALGLKEVPKEWREDPQWREEGGGGSPDMTLLYEARWPSRWTPVQQVRRGKYMTSIPPEACLEVVDYFRVTR